MIIFGRRVQLVWWWRWPKFSVWHYPTWDMRKYLPMNPDKYFTAYDFGFVQVRVWWKGWYT